MITPDTTYLSIDNQNSLKILTKIFTYLISKNIENINFEYSDNKLTYNNTSSKIIEFSLDIEFFSKYQIIDKSILNMPILNIIKDLKSYKGKKIFPQLYFIFDKEQFTINSIYPEKIELYNTTTYQHYSMPNTFKLESIIQNKEPDIIIDISIEKLNILLNNTYVKETSELIFEDNNIVSIRFIDTYGNNKYLKTEMRNISDFKISKIYIENFIIKETMKFFKDNIVQFYIYCNEEKITYNILFDNTDIIFKIVSSIKIEY